MKDKIYFGLKIGFMFWSLLTIFMIACIIYGILTRQFREEYDFRLVFPILLVWNILYCLFVSERQHKKTMAIRKRDLLFVSINAIALNGMLLALIYAIEHYAIYGYSNYLWMKALLEGGILGGFLIYIFIKEIKIWFPLSSCSAIVMIPIANGIGGLDGAGALFLWLMIDIVSLIVEIIITCLLNRKKKVKKKELLK